MISLRFLLKMRALKVYKFACTKLLFFFLINYFKVLKIKYSFHLQINKSKANSHNGLLIVIVN